MIVQNDGTLNSNTPNPGFWNKFTTPGPLSFRCSATSLLKKQTGWWVWLRNFSFKNKDVLLLLYNSFVRPHLEYAIQFWSPHHAKDITKLGVQRWAIKMSPSLCNKHYEERLSHLNLFSLEKRRLRGKLIECFKILNGLTKVDPTKLFVMNDSTRTRNNCAKLKCRQVHSDCTKCFFTNAVVRAWNRLPPSVVQCNSIASFKNNLDRYLLHFNVHYIL